MNSTQGNETAIKAGNLLQLSNLFSLFRIAIIPLLGYYLAQQNETSAVKALIILVIAGLSDGLDGYFARKLSQVSRLGMILDPLADKIMAGSLVIFLLLFRDFPTWLAALIVGRDLLILIASTVLMRGKRVVVSSNLSGKYAFAAIVVLLSCSIIRFEYGVTLMTYIVLALIVLSVTSYVRVFSAIDKGQSPPRFNDLPVYKIIRLCISALVLLLLAVKLYKFLFG